MNESYLYLEGLAKLDIIIIALRDSSKICGLRSIGDNINCVYIDSPALLYDDGEIEIIDKDATFDIDNTIIACISPAGAYIKDEFVKAYNECSDEDF